MAGLAPLVVVIVATLGPVTPPASATVPATRATIVAAPVPAGGGSTRPRSDVASAPASARRARGDATVAAATASVDAGFRFNAIGVLLHVAHPYDPRLRLAVRTSLDGLEWSAWTRMPFERNAGRPGTARHPDDTASQPVWVGEARFVEYRVALDGEPAKPADVERLRFVFINTLDGGESPAQRAASSSSRTVLPASPSRPAIVTRAGWGANESWRRGRPEYARVRMAFVHHTAGTTDYTPEQAPAIVRAVYYYHARVLGWGDIGYNFLVDRFGTVYVGRYGGIWRGVVGAQVAGFNRHSTGVSMMGTFQTSQPTPEMLDALERLLAWKLSLTRVDPLGRTVMRSTGGDRYARGVRVRLRTISAHKDVGITACPGTAAYARMRQIRRSTYAIRRGRAHAALPVGLRGAGDDHPQRRRRQRRRDRVVLRLLTDHAARGGRRQDRRRGPAPAGLDAGHARHLAGRLGRQAAGARRAAAEPQATSGPYTLTVAATDAFGGLASATAKVVVNATVTGVSLKPAWFSPNADGVSDQTVLTYKLERDATPVDHDRTGVGAAAHLHPRPRERRRPPDRLGRPRRLRPGRPRRQLSRGGAGDRRHRQRPGRQERGDRHGQAAADRRRAPCCASGAGCASTCPTGSAIARRRPCARAS